jgi:hypothetical protein
MGKQRKSQKYPDLELEVKELTHYYQYGKL